jgi:hypothetical protein
MKYYKTKSGKVILVDVESCIEKFGVRAGDRIKTPKGEADSIIIIVIYFFSNFF